MFRRSDLCQRPYLRIGEFVDAPFTCIDVIPTAFCWNCYYRCAGVVVRFVIVVDERVVGDYPFTYPVVVVNVVVRCCLDLVICCLIYSPTYVAIPRLGRTSYPFIPTFLFDFVDLFRYANLQTYCDYYLPLTPPVAFTRAPIAVYLLGERIPGGVSSLYPQHDYNVMPVAVTMRWWVRYLTPGTTVLGAVCCALAALPGYACR